MRGYPYWPAVVARDPKNGEYVSLTDTFLKPIKKFHVLFLEYGNQRAWVTSSSIKEYKGIERFNSDKARATKSQRADYTPNKRYVAPFNRAVSYAEELRGGFDEDRLERVLLRYGWVMVGEATQEPDSSAPGTSGRQQAARTTSGKKRRRSTAAAQKPDTALDSEEEVNLSTDSEADSQNNSPAASGASPVLEAAKVRGTASMEAAAVRPAAASVGRRSSAEAASRIDPGQDDADMEEKTSKSTADESGVKLKASSKASETETSGGGKPTKQASRRRASVTNGSNGSSSSENEDAVDSRPPPPKKKAPLNKSLTKTTDSNGSSVSGTVGSKPSAAAPVKTPKSGSSKPVSTPTSARVSAPAVKTPVSGGATSSEKDEFPRVGDLVWGRMAGFPYWPSFVTRSPEGKIPSRVVDPDPDWIRIQRTLLIRIRIRNPDPGARKLRNFSGKMQFLVIFYKNFTTIKI
jgi:hypothetical protein